MKSKHNQQQAAKERSLISMRCMPKARAVSEGVVSNGDPNSLNMPSKDCVTFTYAVHALEPTPGVGLIK